MSAWSSRLRGRQEWKFFGALPRADAPLATAWWAVLLLRGALPAALAVAMGVVTEDEAADLGFPV